MKHWLASLTIIGLAIGFASTGIAAENAKCAVSGKDIAVTDKTARVLVQGKPLYFCCANCSQAFAKAPEKYVKDAGNCPIIGAASTPKASGRVVVNNNLWYVCCGGCEEGVPNNSLVLKELVDVVSKKKFSGAASSPKAKYQGQVYIFESDKTRAEFEKDPAKYAVVYAK